MLTLEMMKNGMKIDFFLDVLDVFFDDLKSGKVHQIKQTHPTSTLHSKKPQLAQLHSKQPQLLQLTTVAVRQRSPAPNPSPSARRSTPDRTSAAATCPISPRTSLAKKKF